VSGRRSFQTSFAFVESDFQASLQILKFLDLLFDGRQLLIQEILDMGTRRYMLGAQD
jgi:hypothetical protein